MILAIYLGGRENTLSHSKAVTTLISRFSGGINSCIVKPFIGHKILFSTQIFGYKFVSKASVVSSSRGIGNNLHAPS